MRFWHESLWFFYDEKGIQESTYDCILTNKIRNIINASGFLFVLVGNYLYAVDLWSCFKLIESKRSSGV